MRGDSTSQRLARMPGSSARKKLGSDPLTKAVAKMKTLYNPFADFERLKRP
jgi:hypothetical protein